ncbi:MAG: phosphotransferase family protein [Acidimicrobiales bacterium]|nr:phosphotransferase family protein [Acidimicrobiales bacterium]
MAEPDLSDLLTTSLAEKLGDVEVEGLTLLTGGASRETWSFDAVDRDGERTPLILQRNRGGGSLGDTSFAVEDCLLAAAWSAGVPIPEVVVDATGSAALGQARITRRIDGESLGKKIVRGDRFASARKLLPTQMGAALAAIHKIPLDDLDGLPEVDVISQIRFGLDGLSVVSPAFELALQWLEDNRCASARRTVVHGDFRIGNLLVDDSGLVAVLDWELAHIGDPIEDLGWLCVRAWRFGGDGVVGGIGDLEDLLRSYREASGEEVSEEQVRWWIVAGTLRWGMICALQASRHLGGHVKSVELATIGRRIAENEHDTLDLLGIPAHPDGQPLPVVDHGASSALALVAAVREQLADRVMPKLSGGDAYTVRVAANALAMVERELSAAPPPPIDVDEIELARRIRGGERISESDVAAVRAAVEARLAVANPRWS